MSDPMNTKMRELTMRLIAMAPEAPPFPEESMVQLKPAPTVTEPPPRRRNPLVSVAVATAVALIVVGLPLILFRGDPSDPAPPATDPPQVTSTTTPTTTPPTTSAPSTTLPPGAPPQISFVESPVPGRIVNEAEVAVAVQATGVEAATLNGVAVDGLFESPEGAVLVTGTVLLEPGRNTIELVLSGGGQTVTERLEVTYLPDAERQIGYLSTVSPGEVVADYIQWLTGDEANQAAFEDGVIGSLDEGVPNDFYIRNENDQLRTLPLSADVMVILQTSAAGPVTPVVVTVAEWLALFKEDGTPWNYEVEEPPSWSEPHFGYFGAGLVNTPYWLTLDAAGTVIQIEQRYLP